MSRERYIKHFGGRLRQVRERRGMTQEGLAKESGVHPVAISRTEGGRRIARLDTIVRLCIALRVQPAELLPSLAWPK